MNNLLIELLKKGESIVTSHDIYNLYPDLTENAVQAKIKRCLKGGELKRLYKGVYSLNQELLKKSVVDERVAFAIDERSFLSGLGALRFHNLIPETVNYKTFIGRKAAKVHATNVNFEIRKMPDDQLSFGVDLVQVGDFNLRIADPVRAIMDTLIDQKLAPKNRHQICAYFRIDEDEANDIKWDKAPVYAYKFRNNKLAKMIATAMTNNSEEK